MGKILKFLRRCADRKVPFRKIQGVRKLELVLTKTVHSSISQICVLVHE
jgi:hypothetical protein